MLSSLSKHARVTGAVRDSLGNELKAKYEAGASIRGLADSLHRSYGFVYTLLGEAGATMRSAGGNHAARADQERITAAIHARRRRRGYVDLGAPETRRRFLQALGQELKSARDQIGLSRPAFIECLDTYPSVASLTAYESGQRVVPVLTFLDICEACDVKPAVLLSKARQRLRSSVESGQA